MSDRDRGVDLAGDDGVEVARATTTAGRVRHLLVARLDGRGEDVVGVRRDRRASAPAPGKFGDRLGPVGVGAVGLGAGAHLKCHGRAPSQVTVNSLSTLLSTL